MDKEIQEYIDGKAKALEDMMIKNITQVLQLVPQIVRDMLTPSQANELEEPCEAAAEPIEVVAVDVDEVPNEVFANEQTVQADE